MSNFVWDNTALPAEKADAVDIPSAASETNYITGSNFNALMTALEEGREAIWKGGGRIAPQATAPISGTFELGDLVFNSVPADGGNVGWVCVTAGTPGTWLEFGVIAADVLNGGGEGGGGEPEAGDIETPARIFGTSSCELGFYPDGLAAGRDGAIGFLTASTNALTLKNERTSAAVIYLEPGTGGWVEVTGTQQFECSEVWVDEINPAASSSGAISILTEDVRIVGSNEAWLGLYPDGAATIRGTFGFDDDTSDTLYVKNTQTSNGHVHIVPGSGGGLKLGPLAASGLATIKGIYVHTATVDFANITNSDGDPYTYTVSGVAMGDIILGCSHTATTTAGVTIQGVVRATNSVALLLVNETGADLNMGSGTLTILWADMT